PHIDFTVGPVHRAVAEATAAAFGDEALPADLTDIPTKAKTIVVVADDLEESHNVAALRIKDAVDPRTLPKRDPARLIVIASKRGELCDFAEPYGGVWLRPEPGQELAALAALARALANDDGVKQSASAAGLDLSVAATGPDTAPGIESEALERAAAILREAASDREQTVAVVYAPSATGVARAAETTKAAANVALLLRGKEAARSFFVLPTEANVNGARDMGVAPELLPGRKPVGGNVGLDFNGIVDAALDGKIKALVVAGDNPLMFAPARQRVETALAKLDFLLVIDQLLTDTAQQAHVVLADAPTYSKDGTFTNADRRVQRLRAAQSLPGDARPAWQTLSQLGQRLAERLGANARFDYEEAGDVTNEIAAKVLGYERFVAYGFFGWGNARAVSDALPGPVALQPVAMTATPSANGHVALLTGRTLYTSLEGAAIRSPDADKLHREEGVFVNQYDASEWGIAMGDDVVLQNGSPDAMLSLKAIVTTAVPRGAVFVSSYYDGGAVGVLLPQENGSMALPLVTLTKA
ncbi:MAG: molybdopterin-dependent oxidoreductase, partial [Dehalococcoidia bacterium]